MTPAGRSATAFSPSPNSIAHKRRPGIAATSHQPGTLAGISAFQLASMVCEIGQGGLAVAGSSGPPQQPLAAVEEGDKAGGLTAVGPGGLQVRARRTDFEGSVEGGVAIAEPDQRGQRLHNRPA